MILQTNAKLQSKLRSIPYSSLWKILRTKSGSWLKVKLWPSPGTFSKSWARSVSRSWSKGEY